MEFPEPYHSLPRRQWRKLMKATPKSYATGLVKFILRNRKWTFLRHSDKAAQNDSQPKSRTGEGKNGKSV